MVYAALALVVKLVAVGFTTLDSVRARFVPAIVGLAASALLVIGGLVALADGPLASVLLHIVEPPWMLPLLLAAISCPTTLLAFRAERAEAELSPRHEHLGRAAMGWLGNALLDLVGLGIVAIAWHFANEPF